MDREERGKSIVPADKRPIKKYENIEIVSTYPSDRDEIDPYDYLQVIWRHRKIGFAFLIVVVITALFISILTKPMYEAKSTVEVSLKKPQVVAFDDVLEVDTKDEAFFTTQRDLIKSRAMAEAVISKYDLWNHPDFAVAQQNLNPVSILFSYLKKLIRTIEKPIRGLVETEYSKGKPGEEDREKMMRDDIINTFLERIEVLPSIDSRLITISFTAYSPKFAAKMADAIADTFVEWSLERGLQANRDAREFLGKQIEEVKGDLLNAEKSLHQFEVQNDIVGLDKDMNLIYRQLETLNTELANTASEKTTKESLYKSIESGNPNEILEVINDPLIQNLKGEYSKLLVEYSNLSSVFKPEYPPLKRLQAQINGVRARLNEETKDRVAALRADYQTVAQKEKLLQERVDEQEERALALNEKTIQYRNLEREVLTSKSIYESLLQRFKETDVSGGLKSSSIQVVDHAAIPKAPFTPNTPRNIILAVLVGLIGAVGIAFMREFFDRTIKTPEEIREKMQLPVLGGVLKLSESKYYSKLDTPIEKLYLSDPRSAFSEAIRTLRASIMLSSQEYPLRSILITSCWPGEGKTTIAINLALSLAYDQKRVLLVESDLRHPGIGKFFGIDRSKLGLSNYLMFNSELTETIHSTYVPQLFVLPCGSIIPSTPSELLQSEAMRQLLERLSGEFDYVVIDSSPAIGLADSLMLSTVADGTVLVSSVGITMQKDIAHVVRRLSDINARFLGVVINRLELGREAYFYDRYYKSYYNGRDRKNTIEVVEGDVVLSRTQPEPSEKFDETGELKDKSYPSILLSFQNQKKTGVLNIDSKLKLRIYLQEGFPVFVEGGNNSTLLGNIILAEGAIEKKDLEAALNDVARTKKKIGEVLIGMGSISHHELDRILEHQIKEKLIRGYQCTLGAYSFKAGNSFVGSILTYKVNPLYVIYEGVKRFEDVKEIERKFIALRELNKVSEQKTNEVLDDPELLVDGREGEKDSFGLEGLLVNSTPDIVERLRDMSFSPSEFRFLKSLKDSQSLVSVLSRNQLSRENILKLLYFLSLVGFVEVISNTSYSKSEVYDFRDEFSSQGG